MTTTTHHASQPLEVSSVACQSIVHALDVFDQNDKIVTEHLLNTHIATRSNMGTKIAQQHPRSLQGAASL